MFPCPDPPPAVPHSYQNYLSKADWSVSLTAWNLCWFFMAHRIQLNLTNIALYSSHSAWVSSFLSSTPSYKCHAPCTRDYWNVFNHLFSLLSTLSGNCLPLPDKQTNKTNKCGLHLLNPLKYIVLVLPHHWDPLSFSSFLILLKMSALQSNPTSAIYQLCLGMLF